MGRICTICRHEKREGIDKALLAGDPYRGIARRFGASPPAVLRHREHIPGRLAKAHAAKEVAQADSLLDQVRDLTEEARGILRRVKAKDPKTALGAIREIRGTLELLARLLGEIQDQAVTVNVLATPEGAAVQAKIVRALAPYPDARAAVVQILEGVPS